MATIDDDFDRADASTLGANWTDQIAGIGIISNNASRNADAGAQTYRSAYYSGVAWGPNHTSRAFVAHFGATNSCHGGVMVRASGTGAGSTAYVALVSSLGLYYLFKMTAEETFDLLQTFVETVAIGDAISMEAYGTTIKVFLNGSQVGTDQTDSSYATGSPGIILKNNTGTDPLAALSEWRGDGDLAGNPWNYYAQQ